MTRTQSIAVRIESVDKTFSSGTGAEVHALSDVSLEVAAGEFVSLIGPSGCGKSTLMRLVADLEHITSGEITVFGKPAAQARKDQDYGIAFQQAGLLPWRTVRANIELPLEIHGVEPRDRRDRSDELLALIGLTDFANHHPDQLSGGMQQRVAIARAMAERPRLLLMDEPFGALDEMTREHMQDQLVALCQETGAAVIFVTHSIPEAVFLSDRVVVMSPRPGKIKEIVPLDFASRDEGLREDSAFYEGVTAVRALLHHGTVGARGVDDR